MGKNLELRAQKLFNALENGSRIQMINDKRQNRILYSLLDEKGNCLGYDVSVYNVDKHYVIVSQKSNVSEIIAVMEESQKDEVEEYCKTELRKGFEEKEKEEILGRFYVSLQS